MSEEMEERENGSQENSQSQSLEFASPAMQDARAFLRERFLRFVTGIVGANVNFNLYENSNVSGEFRGCDVDCLDIYVRNLQTPLGKIPEAIVRSSDIISFEVESIKNSD